MDIILNRLPRTFFWSLKQRPHVNVKAQIGKRRGHDLGTPVVTVLAQFGDHHPRATPLLAGKGVDLDLELFPPLGRIIGSSINARHLLNVSTMSAENLLKGITDFAYRRP